MESVAVSGQDEARLTCETEALHDAQVGEDSVYAVDQLRSERRCKDKDSDDGKGSEVEAEDAPAPQMTALRLDRS